MTRGDFDVCRGPGSVRGNRSNGHTERIKCFFDVRFFPSPFSHEHAFDIIDRNAGIVLSGNELKELVSDHMRYSI